VSVTDDRQVAPFTSVELAGANTVVIHVGSPRSVAITGDDNLVARVTTEVRDGRLIIDDTGDFTTTAPMRVVVSIPSMTEVVLSGAGTVGVDGVSGDRLDAQLTGTGTLTVIGSARRASAILRGTGTLDLHGLAASVGLARLDGTGTIEIDATSTLEADLTGTGTIVYGGSPTVTMRNTGEGEVVPR
jgi:hypothetical protein